jgi:hypothetical protein
MKPCRFEIAEEKIEQDALVEWMSYHPVIKDLFFKIHNEGKRTPRQGAKLKRQGLKAGVSDIFIPFPTKSHHGLWIELKRRKKYRCTNEQQIWIDRMNELGYFATFAFGWEHAREIIEKYLSGKLIE